jgi:glycosyltransferase involved in cell wall biosynthesis
MNISILLPDLRGGGVERMRLVLAKEFMNAGHNVEFLLMNKRGDLLDEALKEFTIVDLHVNRLRNLPVALIRYLNINKPDVLLAGMWPLTVIAPTIQRLSRSHCKVIVSEHAIISAQYHEKGALHRLLLRLSCSVGYRLAHGNIGVSKGVVKDMENISNLKEENFTVVHNPVSPRHIPNKITLEMVDKIWSAPSGARILSVGKMKAVKNHALLIRAFANLTLNDARLVIVGHGECKSDLYDLAVSLGIEEKVIFAGFHLDPTPFYMTANVFVLSSNFEGFGNVLLEAMANGLSIVSTSCPSGPCEILDNGRFGYLTPVGDENAMSNAILKAIHSPFDSDLLKRRARDFKPEISAQKYLNLMD